MNKPTIFLFFRPLIALFILLHVVLVSILAQTVDLKITTFNTEWLSCDTNGPSDEEGQMNNIVSLIQTINPDIIALQEVGTSTTYATIDTLVKKLGINEWAGDIVATTPTNCGQNQGIIYKKSHLQLVNSSLLSNGANSQGNSYYYNWTNGRYPVIHDFVLTIGSTNIPFSIINIHAKAMSDETSYSRRLGASEGLKGILDGTNYNTSKIIITGDFNDYLIGSQTATYSNSPYKNFMDDTENYQSLTSSLTDPYYSSPVIDNIIITNELASHHVANSTIRETSATNTISNYRNTTSDHTPISALFRFTSNNPTDCQAIDYSESFASSLGDFIPYSVEGTQTWHWRNIYGAYVSGYASSTNNPNEDWLISPAFDLSDKESGSLSFEHALNYAQEASERASNHTLWISTNYTEGDPKNANWTQLSIPTMPLGNSWTYVNSGNINLSSQWMKENVRFAFKYMATSSMAGTWEIKNLLFNATCEPVAIPSISNDNKVVFAQNRNITVLLEHETSIRIFNIVGNTLYNDTRSENSVFPVSQAGIYLVCIGNECYKIAVR